jgi:hypothetical protein
MKIKNIKTSDEALKLLKENKEFRLQLKDRLIFYVSGVLGKIQDNKLYILINKKWVDCGGIV